MAAVVLVVPKPVSPTWRNFREALRRHPTAIAGGLVLLLMILIAIFAPWLATVDPQAVAPVKRLKQPGAEFWFGSDMMGRDVYSRVLYGARVSLAIGIAVAIFSTVAGLAIGLATGFVRWLDAIVMRVMDGLMSIPPV
ncbi:MAG: ABC transporter permease, partial [Pseudomonadota bacterium]|nr:ABC transporter permease [Pseudomonadota bacterium]